MRPYLKAASIRAIHPLERRIARRLWKKAGQKYDRWPVPIIVIRGEPRSGKDAWANVFIKFIEGQKNPQNQRIIDDAFAQLTKLELDHQKLSEELKESNEDKRVIYAVIANFQMQIEVLQNLVEQLEEFDKMNSEETII